MWGDESSPAGILIQVKTSSFCSKLSRLRGRLYGKKGFPPLPITFSKAIILLVLFPLYYYLVFIKVQDLTYTYNWHLFWKEASIQCSECMERIQDAHPGKSNIRNWEYDPIKPLMPRTIKNIPNICQGAIELSPIEKKGHVHLSRLPNKLSTLVDTYPCWSTKLALKAT